MAQHGTTVGRRDSGSRTAQVLSLASRAALWPRVSPNEARIARLLADTRLDERLARALCIRHLHVTSAERPAFRAPGRVELDFDGSLATVLIDLDNFPALKIVAPESARGAPKDADTLLRNTVATLVLKPLIEALTTLGVRHARLTTVHRHSASDSIRAQAKLAIDVGGRHVECLLVELGERWLDAFEALVRSGRVRFAGPVAALSIPGRTLLGRQMCSIATLNGLRSGDVLIGGVATQAIAPFADPQATGELTAHWGTSGARAMLARVSLKGKALTLLEAPRMTDEIDYNENADTDPPAAVDIEQLELPVQFVLDTVALPIAQLASLRAGYVIELPTPLRDARVRLTSYGQTIGFGELVTVGEHLGVRIVEMANIDDSVQ